MLDSLPAEQSLLGAAMLWPDALDDISLAESDFQSQANGLIWRAIQKLLVRGEAIDALTVADQLERDGHLDDVGGLEYLSAMAQSVYSPAGIKSHAEQIRERGVRRGLLAALRTIGESLHTDGDIAAVLDRAQAQIMAIGERAETRQPVSVLDVARDRITALEDILDGKDKAWSTGLTDLDAKLGNIRAGDLVVIAGRPAMGKSAFAIQVAAHMATPESPALIFSLEMSSAQLVDRLMSSAGRVNLKKFRTGALEEQDWDGLTVALGRMQEMPVYLDDHSHTLGQILSTARQFRRRHGLGVVVVDYIGLVTTEADSREQEVAKITRSLKLAAKQLECPILALSQLNRKLEDRTDRRPQMADLRECLPVDEWVDTPAGPVQLNTRPDSIITVNDEGSFVADCSFIEKRYNTVYRVSTQFGAFSATARHQVLTGTGWKEVRDIVPGRDVIACPTRIPHANRGHERHGRLLGWLIGNGNLSSTPSLVYRNELHDDVCVAVEAFGVTVRKRKVQRSPNVTEAYLSNGVESGSLLNPLMAWIRGLGLGGVKACEKFIPDAFLGTSDETHRALLRGLFESDGTVTHGRAKYATCSERLARQVKWLLHTVGVRSTLLFYENGHSGMWDVSCSTADNANLVGICSDRGRFGELESASGRRVDPSPAIFVELMEELYRGRQRIQRRVRGGVKQIPKARMASMLVECPVATIEESPFMTMQDMGWASVYSVEKQDGDVRVCDLHVPGTHNFLTNGLVVHNSGSVEQDSDQILMLYRDEVYNPDSPNKGICEVLIRKNRHGETGTVLTTFCGENVRFSDFFGQYTEQNQRNSGRRMTRGDL